MTPDRVTRLRRPHPAGALGILALLLVGTAPGPGILAIGSIGLAASLAVLLGPADAVGAVAASLPLVFITARLGGTHWGLLELALLCCGAASAAEVARLMVARRGEWRLADVLRPLDLTAVAGAIAVVGLASLKWVADDRAAGSSQRELRRVILEPLVVILAVRLSPMVDVRRLVARCLVIGGVVVSIMALAQVGSRSSGVEVGVVFRPIGSYPHPNNLALYLERIVWLPLGLVGGRVSSRIALATTGLVALACVATLSRGGIIALVVGALIWLALSRRRVPTRALGVGLAASVGLLLVARAGGDGTESLGSREKIWSAAIDMIRDYPVTGIGIDQFYQLYGTRYVDPGGWSERYTSHPHNLVLDFWLQLGLIGLAILGGIVWLAVRRGWAVRGGRNDLVGAALIAGLVGGFAHGMIDNGFFLPDLAAFLWLTLALVAPSPTVESSP